MAAKTVSPKKRSTQRYKWIKYFSNEIEEIKKEIQSLKERVKILEQRLQRSNNNSP